MVARTHARANASWSAREDDGYSRQLKACPSEILRRIFGINLDAASR